jgi:hypothetical protein
MSALKCAAVFILIAVMMMHCGNVSAPSQTNGFIKGKILLKDSLSQTGMTVVLEGTNFMAITDSAGNYLFFNVPEGEYKLAIFNMYYSYVFSFADARVIAGDTVTIQDFIIKQGMSNYFDNLYLQSTIQIDSVRIFDVTGTSLGAIRWYSYGNVADIPIAFISADSVGFSFLVTRVKNYAQYAVEDSTIVRQNGSIIYAAKPSKGRAKTGFYPLTGLDTFTIFADGDSIGSFVISDPSLVKDNYVNIFTGKITLTPAPLIDSSMYIPTGVTGYGMSSYCNYYTFFGNSCYGIYINSFMLEHVNWDIYLVNDSLNDTCYWGNPQPEWGNTSTTVDNPFFYGGGIVGDTAWHSEEIISQNLPSGTYSICIKYYEAFPDSVPAIPMLNIALGKSASNAMLEKFYQLEAPHPMQKNEVWYCGKLRLPEKQFIPSDTAGSIKKLNSLKKRA